LHGFLTMVFNEFFLSPSDVSISETYLSNKSVLSQDYEDNLMRFALFAWAACEAPLCMPAICPFGDEVVIIANDWQTGTSPC